MIDILMVSYQRLEFTKRSIQAIEKRTKTPYRLIVIDNGSTDGSLQWLLNAFTKGIVHQVIPLKENFGIHWAWNMGLSVVKSEPYFITTDNDIIPPRLDPDWLAQLISLMDQYPNFGSISLQPQIFVGGVPKLWEDEDIFETRWAGAVFRAMRTEVVKGFGGWQHVKRQGRDGEERWIAERFHEAGFKVGYAKNLRAWHCFGKNWGYPDVTPHGHNPVYPPVENYDNIGVDPDTLKPL